MKGSHTVDGFMDWLDKTDTIPFHTKLHLKKRIREAADLASTTGKTQVMPVERQHEVVMAMRFFDDGSMDMGWPEDAKWPGKDKQPINLKKPGLAPPPEKEI